MVRAMFLARSHTGTEGHFDVVGFCARMPASLADARAPPAGAEPFA